MQVSRFYKHQVPVLIFGAFIISFSSVFVKTSQVPALVSAFYRVFFGCLFLVGACWIKGEFRKKSLKKNLLAILCGLVFSLDLLCWHLSIHYIGPGLATILGNCQVFVLAIVGWMVFKERLGIGFVFSVPLVFTGLFMVIGLDLDLLSSDYRWGMLMGGLTAVWYSIFLLLIRYIQSNDTQSPDTQGGPRADGTGGSVFYYQVVMTAGCSFFLGVAILGSGQSFAIQGTASLFSLLGLGFFSQAVAWVLISNSLPGVPASRAGLILLLQPALSFVWDVFFFNRQTGGVEWAGVGMVLVAIYLGMMSRTKN